MRDDKTTYPMLPFPLAQRNYVTDFEQCDDPAALERLLRRIDSNGYDVIAATQNVDGVYTIIFRRPARE